MENLTPSAHLFKFKGGLKLDLHHAESTFKPIAQPPLPQTLTLPMQQHIGSPTKPLVNVGDRVLKGQQIAERISPVSAPVHASSSGIVTAIEERPIPHPSGLNFLSVVIEPDGKDEWVNKNTSVADYKNHPPESIIEHIQNHGITGLGGAAFPSAVKLTTASKQSIHTLLLNAAECEPHIACDDMLMRERANEIISGIEILRHCLSVEKCIIGIEDSMPEAYYALNEAIKQYNATQIDIIIVPTIYPMGGERQLIKVITGKEVPHDGLPTDIGILCHNIATAYAIHNAVVKGEPFISRIVTIAGEGINQHRNLEVLLGTPISHLVNYCDGYNDKVKRLIMGGPMMGFALPDDSLPIIKASNCILAAGSGEVQDPTNEKPCIRCGNCEQVCPAGLLPQQLFWHSKAKDFDKAQDYQLFDCIECGCCSYVCPSEIPLVHYYRFAKTEIRNTTVEQEKAEHARQRFEFRNKRMQRIEQEKAERMQQRKKALNAITQKDNKEAKQAEIQASIDRSQAKKAKTNELNNDIKT